MHVRQLVQSLREAHQEIESLTTRRIEYEENMKKAFMRGRCLSIVMLHPADRMPGVCALNMEAMTMFRDGEGLPATLTESQKSRTTFTSSRTHERDDVPRVQVQTVPAPHASVLVDQGNIRPKPLQHASVSRQGPQATAVTREAPKQAPRQNPVTTARRTVEHTGTSIVCTVVRVSLVALMRIGC